MPHQIWMNRRSKLKSMKPTMMSPKMMMILNYRMILDPPFSQKINPLIRINKKRRNQKGMEEFI